MAPKILTSLTPPHGKVEIMAIILNAATIGLMYSTPFFFQVASLCVLLLNLTNELTFSCMLPFEILVMLGLNQCDIEY